MRPITERCAKINRVVHDAVNECARLSEELTATDKLKGDVKRDALAVLERLAHFLARAAEEATNLSSFLENAPVSSEDMHFKPRS